MEADDILHEAFVKVFTKIKYFRKEGSLEGWIRRTVVNTAINFVKKDARYQQLLESASNERVLQNANSDIYQMLTHEELLKMIQELPPGYRTVFNLNVLEGYTHKEIGQMLNISDNTSKSQLTRARQVLQKKIAALIEEKKRAKEQADPVIYAQERFGGAHAEVNPLLSNAV